ncbi:MAG: aldose epimerase family protein [Burkholderiaceae bacterium]
MRGIQVRPYGTLSTGQVVYEYTLDNGAGVSLSAINLGGIVTALRTPDRHGASANLVLALPSLLDYETRNPHFGTIVGRYANRIAQGRFTLGGERFQVALNDGDNTLHGGPLGFGKRWWAITELPEVKDGSIAIRLTLVSEGGDQGYPGRLDVSVDYTLTPGNEWRIDYSARCDRDTVVNLTHHDYFNLAGSGSMLDHQLMIAASRYCTVDAGLIPQQIAPVEGTPFDLRQAVAIGARIRDGNPQLVVAKGYDHNWVLADASPAAVALPLQRIAARLEDPGSGRVMEIFTTEPGLQFYSGNFLDGSLLSPSGTAYRQSDGLCLETQHFPNAPNRPDFPSTSLRAGDHYASTTVHRCGLSNTDLP